MNKTYRIGFMMTVCLVLFGCKEKEPISETKGLETLDVCSENAVSSTISDAYGDRTDIVIYNGASHNAFAEQYALFQEYSDQGRISLHYYDVLTGKSSYYCFDPGCEHKPPQFDMITGEYDFANGYIVKCSEGDEPGVLYDHFGQRIRDLPFAVGHLVQSDHYILALWAMNGEYWYYLYDPIDDKILQKVNGSNRFFLEAAVGESYYGNENNQIFYISSTDFWEGHIEKAIIISNNR